MGYPMFIRRTTDKSQKMITPKKQIMNTVKNVVSLDGMLVSELITHLQQFVSIDSTATLEGIADGEDYYDVRMEITYQRPETDLERRSRLQAKKKEHERKKNQKKTMEERERAIYEKLKQKYENISP